MRLSLRGNGPKPELNAEGEKEARLMEQTNLSVTVALAKLRAAAKPMVQLALVMQTARSLSEWSDAEARMADLMEAAGDTLDQTSPEDQGFVGNHKQMAPIEALLARGSRLLEALHRYCGPATYPEPGDRVWEDTE